jgi:hypothetical protein
LTSFLLIIVTSRLHRLGADFEKAAEALGVWGEGEGEDLGVSLHYLPLPFPLFSDTAFPLYQDILSGSTTILNLFSAALFKYAEHETSIRELMKSVRTREENLDALRKQRKSLGKSLDSASKKLNKMTSSSDNYANTNKISEQTEVLNQLRDQARVMDSEIMTEEAALGDFKRKSSKEWMELKFGGLSECSEKGSVRPSSFFPAFITCLPHSRRRS